MGTIRLSATSQIRCLKVGKLPSWKHVLASVRGLLNTFWLSDIHLDTCCEIVFDLSNDTSTGKNSSFLSRSDILPAICSVLSSALYYDILCAVLTFRLTHEIVWKERTPKSTHLSNMVPIHSSIWALFKTLCRRCMLVGWERDFLSWIEIISK